MEQRGGTAERNAALWGARPRDWAEVQEGQVRPLYEAVLDELRVGSGMRLLDVGCGAGLASQLAAERGARVSGFDATAPLLAVARERVPGADFQVGDMEGLPYDDDSFDAVVGFNSFQFAADPAVALGEAARVAVAGAPIAVATWGSEEECEARAPLGALGGLLPPPPPGAPGPFALSDPGALEGFVQRAGLRAGAPRDVECMWRYPDVEMAMRGLKAAGPGTAAIREAGEERVDHVLRDALAQFTAGDGTVTIRNVFRYAVATSDA
jgi:SAM-dependent methyltransferase